MAIDSNLGVKKGNAETLDMSTVQGVLVHYAELIVKQTKENLEKKKAGGLDSNASYQLSESISPLFEVQESKFGFTYTAKVFMEDYWYYVDKGRASGKMPPIDSILFWIRNKEGLRVPGMSKVGDIRERGKYKRKAYTIEDIRKSYAFGIARKIQHHGTKGNNFVSDVLTKEFWDNFKSDLNKAAAKDVAINIKTGLDNDND